MQWLYNRQTQPTEGYCIKLPSNKTSTTKEKQYVHFQNIFHDREVHHDCRVLKTETHFGISGNHIELPRNLNIDEYLVRCVKGVRWSGPETK